MAAGPPCGVRALPVSPQTAAAQMTGASPPPRVCAGAWLSRHSYSAASWPRGRVLTSLVSVFLPREWALVTLPE